MDATGFQQLLRQAQERQSDAEHHLLVAVRPYLEGLARAYADPIRASESTSDLVQEACLRLWGCLPDCRASGTDEECLAGFLAWSGEVLRTTGSNWRRHGRRKKRRPPRPPQPIGAGDSTEGAAYVEPPASEPTPSADVRAGEEAQRVQKTLAEMPDETVREVVRLYFLEERTLTEIGERLGLTYDIARNRLRRGRNELRCALEGSQ